MPTVRRLSDDKRDRQNESRRRTNKGQAFWFSQCAANDAPHHSKEFWGAFVPLERSSKRRRSYVESLPTPLATNRLVRGHDGALRSLALNLGFEGFFAANIDLDLLGLGFRLLGEFDLQHTLVIVGAHLPGIDGTGQRERPGEASVLPLDATEVLLFLLLLDLALAMDGEGGVLDEDIDVFLVNAWDFELQGYVVLVFVDIHRRCEAGGC